MGVIVSIPNLHSPVHNCLNFGLNYGETAIGAAATAATFNITVSSGGTISGTVYIYLAGVRIAISDGDWNGVSDEDRATFLYNSLKATLYFSDDICTIIQFGASIGVTWNTVGAQSNWPFSDGGITQIAITETNGTKLVFSGIIFT